MLKPPVSSPMRNLIESNIQPNVVHSRNTYIFNMYVKYLLQKLISVFDFDLPDDWADNYFKYVLMGYGFICVFNTDRYGVVAQQCGLGDNITLYHQPQYAIVTNPVFRKTYELKIGRQCEIIKLQPDYSSPLDLVSTYADLMTMALETAAINLLNSKTSYVFFADSQRMAESYKKAYDQIASGNPMTVIDKSVLNEEGRPDWMFFTQNVGQNYITDRLLIDLRTIENEFDSMIGIPNANTQKRERLITDEVLSNRAETSSLIWKRQIPGTDDEEGHVEIVEAVSNGRLTISYSAYSGYSPQSDYATFFGVRYRNAPDYGDPASDPNDPDSRFTRNNGNKYYLNEYFVGVIHNPYAGQPTDVTRLAIYAAAARRKRGLKKRYA